MTPQTRSALKAARSALLKGGASLRLFYDVSEDAADRTMRGVGEAIAEMDAALEAVNVALGMEKGA